MSSSLFIVVDEVVVSAVVLLEFESDSAVASASCVGVALFDDGGCGGRFL